LVEVKDCVTRHDSYNTTRDFLDCIRDSAMAIRGQQLQKLQQHCATKNDQTYEGNLPGIATEVDVYFSDPRCPWQRGSNENTNRLLRQYLPRGTDLSVHSQAKLSAIARQLNERPRKTLLYQTAVEKFAECVAMIG
jgi:hypothetical protein